MNSQSHQIEVVLSDNNLVPAELLELDEAPENPDLVKSRRTSSLLRREQERLSVAEQEDFFKEWVQSLGVP